METVGWRMAHHSLLVARFLFRSLAQFEKIVGHVTLALSMVELFFLPICDYCTESDLLQLNRIIRFQLSDLR